jgi:hypothetical protein
MQNSRNDKPSDFPDEVRWLTALTDGACRRYW